MLKRRHDRTTCLLCSVTRLANTRQSRWRKISASSQQRTRTETESSYGGAGNEGESPVMLPWQNKGGLEGITSVDSSGTDITSVGQRSLGDNFKSRSVVRKEVLRLAEQLCNPILYRTCKQALLQLKQMYGDVFNDICVYSDICAIMSSATHRVCARRFLQELFLDAPFSEMYEDPLGILSVPNNAESEDGAFGEKMSLGSEGAMSEDLTAEATNWKVSGPKMNGFDGDQRSGQGYELEVILESDARSESSDVCRGSGEGGRGRTSTVGSHGSITPLESKVFREDVTAAAVEVKVELASDLHSAHLKTISSEVDCHITVSRSSQQLRKEFFNAALSPESQSFEKDADITTETRAAQKCDESFVAKVASSISKSQGMLETKLPPQSFKEEQVSQTASVSTHKSEGVKNETVGPVNLRKQKDFNPITKKLKPDINEKTTTKDFSAIESATGVNNVNKSPQPVKKGKRIINTKPSSIPNKNEGTSTKSSAGQFSTTLSVDLSNQGRENVPAKLKNDVKVESVVGKKEFTKVQTKTSEVTSDTSSKLATKSAKSKANEMPSSSGKPPTGSGRQRKKATTKTPNRDSLDSMKKGENR